MGMFDNVRCKRELPDGWRPPGQLLQTKDFDCYLRTYTITEDGKLLCEFDWGDVDIKFHGIFIFYGIEGDINSPDARWHEYGAKFTDGALVEIELIKNYLIKWGCEVR